MSWLGILGWYAAGYTKGFPGVLNDTQVFYPHGVDLIYSSAFSIDGFLAIPLALIGGYVFAYNLVSVLSLALSGFTAYLLSFHFTKCKLASGLGGIVFGFGGFQMVHALGHYSIFGPFWLPLLALSLERVRQKPTATWAFLAGMFFVLMSLTNGYLGMIAVTFVIIFVSIVVLQHLPRSPNLHACLSLIKRYFPIVISFSFPMIVLIPILQHAIGNVPSWNPMEYVLWSADPLDYITPSFIHPLFGNYIIAHRNLGYGNWVEHSLYLGITPLFLAFYALARKRSDVSLRYGVVAGAFFVLSLGPVLHFAGVDTNIPLPYTVLTSLPFFHATRSVARIGVVVLLAVGLLSSIGMSNLLRSLELRGVKLQKRHAVAFIFIALTICELFSAPYPVTNPNQFSGPAYVWLSQQKGDFAVLEYPISHLDRLAGYHVLISGKATVSGFVDIATKTISNYQDSLTFLEPSAGGTFCSVDTPLLLSLNIRFVLFQKPQYAAAFGERALVRALLIANTTEGLVFVRDFGDAVIYMVSPTAGTSSPSVASQDSCFISNLGNLTINMSRRREKN